MAAAAAEKARAESERRAAEAQRECAAAQAAVERAEAAAAAAQASVDRSTAACDASAKKAAQTAAARSAAATTAFLKQVQAEVDELLVMSSETQAAASQHLQNVSQDGAALAAQCQSELTELRALALSLRSELDANAAASQAACQAEVAGVRAREDVLAGWERQLASLGHKDVDGLCAELQRAHTQLTWARDQAGVLEAKVAASERARVAAAAQMQEAREEAAGVAREKAGLARELGLARQEQARLAGSVADWQARHADATAETKRVAAELLAAKTELCRSTDTTAAANAALGRERATSQALGNQVAALQAQANAERVHAWAKVQQGVAARLRALRGAYFTPVGQDVLVEEVQDGVTGAGSTRLRGGGAEEVVGLGLCKLTHEQVMKCLDTYMDRQRRASTSLLQEQQQQQGQDDIQGDTADHDSASSVAAPEVGGHDGGLHAYMFCLLHALPGASCVPKAFVRK